MGGVVKSVGRDMGLNLCHNRSKIYNIIILLRVRESLVSWL